jgi:hypothetical protein
MERRPGSIAIGLLLLDLPDMARGEVARIWLFLTPLAVIRVPYGLSLLARKRWQRYLIIVLLAAQLLVFNAFLRVVTTGVTNPPELTYDSPTSGFVYPFEVNFDEQIALAAYAVEPPIVAPGAALEVKLIWQGLTQMARPYTVFVHLLGPDGVLVAQLDSMPKEGRAPTTCWVPWKSISDVHILTIPVDTPLGGYTLLTGLYIWETEERLPVISEVLLQNDSTVVTTVNMDIKA